MIIYKQTYHRSFYIYRGNYLFLKLKGINIFVKGGWTKENIGHYMYYSHKPTKSVCHNKL